MYLYTIKITKQIEIMRVSSYTYSFKNGTYKITKGLTTKFDWHVCIELNHGYICLDRSIFLTKKEAIKVTEKLLSKYNLL